jgi:3D (Asp-Asp-Asp) domain-containing protein
MAVPGQTDDTPLTTADMSTIDPDNIQNWIAVSRNLLHEYPYGTRVQVQGTDGYDGIYIVHDTMNKRYVDRIDILVCKKCSVGKWWGIISKL